MIKDSQWVVVDQLCQGDETDPGRFETQRRCAQCTVVQHRDTHYEKDVKGQEKRQRRRKGGREGRGEREQTIQKEKIECACYFCWCFC